MPLLYAASACWVPDCCRPQHTVNMVHVGAQATVGRQMAAAAAAAVLMGQPASTAAGLAMS